jgi:NAD(P)-dependent dehydrogenase (short-subunit alcohol dehydrogenase family)
VSSLILRNYLLRAVLIFSEGCIINVASLLGLKGGKGSAAYAASKAGVIGKAPSYELVQSY